jgi:hypothetical protein
VFNKLAGVNSPSMERKMKIKFDFEKQLEGQGNFFGAEIEAEVNVYTQRDDFQPFEITAVRIIDDDGYPQATFNPTKDKVPYLPEIVEIVRQKWRDMVGYESEEVPLQPWDFC